MKSNILTFFLLLPLLFSVIIATPLIKNSAVLIRRLSKTFASIIFFYSMFLLYIFKPEIAEYQFVETLQIPLLQKFGANFSIAIDGISIVLIILAAFIFLLALIASKNHITKSHKLYYSLCFLLEFAILGVFLAKDILLFFVFWELELIPMYFLINIFGSGKKEYSAMKFLLYTFFGSLFILASLIALVYYNALQTGILSFDMETLSQAKFYPYPIIAEFLMFIGFFVGFAVKLPVFPIHTWLPDAHTDAPTPVSMILAGIMLKMGAYGIIRFNLGFFPELFSACGIFLIILGIINMFYAAICAYYQQDFKRLVAYSSISHMGLVLIGLGALSLTSFIGAVFQLVSHGLISAGLFMMVGIIYFRCKTRNLDELGGLQNKMPSLSYFSTVIILAGLGVPLLSGFIAEALVFFGAFHQDNSIILNILIVCGIFSMILTAVYLLSAFTKAFWGNLLPKYNTIKDITPHEFLILISLVVTIIFLGIYPNGLINVFENSAKYILSAI